MRSFRGLLFLGAGDHSKAEVMRLHARLAEGLNISGGLQQTPNTLPEYWEQKTHLEEVIRDLAAALIGQDICFGSQLPYPPSVMQ
jgi:hypothetical protein